MSTDKELFEKKSVFRAIMSLAIPSVIGQLILVIYNMADTFFVGLTKNDAMITAVTVCMPAFMFLSAISNLFGIGAASVMARSMGKGNLDRAKNASSFAVLGCLITTVFYCLFAVLFKDFFINVLGGSNPEVHDKAISYLLITVVICGIPTALNTLFSHLIRAQGKSLYASLGIVIGGVLNIALDPLFMFVILPSDKAALGAGIATGVSNVIALFYYVIILIKKKDQLIVRFKPNKECFKNSIPLETIIVGIPACLMTLFENISYAILDNLMSQVSIAAQAGVGVAKKINMFAHSTVRGMTQGVLPLIGYNKSCGNRKRMKKVVFVSGAMSLVIAVICTTISLTLSQPLTSIFIQIGETGSLDYGARFLQILCLGAPFSAVAYTIISFFQAVGKAWRSLILALLRKGLLDIPLMYILQKPIPTYGIVWATPIADSVCSVVAILLFVIYLKRHGENKGEFKTIEK